MRITTYLPEKLLSNKDLAGGFEEEKFNRLQEKLGIYERRVSDVNESALDLAYNACIKLSQSELDKVDYILYCTQSPEYFLPSSSCLLQEKLGLKNGIGALDINLGCSGYVYCLSIGKSLIESGIASNILIVTTDTYTKYIHDNDLTNRFIFGDGATATLIDKADVEKIHSFDFGTDGSGAEDIIVRGRNFNDGDDRLDFFSMNGPKVFKFVKNNIPSSVSKVLEHAGKDSKDIKGYVFHQANKKMLHTLADEIGVERKAVIVAMSKVGNTVSSSIPFVLKDVLDSDSNNGDYLLSGFGVGYSWSSCILELN